LEIFYILYAITKPAAGSGECARCSFQFYLPIMPIIAFPVNSGEFQYVDRVKSHINTIWGKCQYWHFPQMLKYKISRFYNFQQYRAFLPIWHCCHFGQMINAFCTGKPDSFIITSATIYDTVSKAGIQDQTGCRIKSGMTCDMFNCRSNNRYLGEMPILAFPPNVSHVSWETRATSHIK